MTEPSPTSPVSSQPAPAPSGQPPAQSAPGAQPGAEPTAAPAKLDRPEGLDEKFWDPDGGKVRFDEIGKELGDLRAIRAERDAVKAGVPEKPEGYQPKLPEGLKLPDGVEFQVDESDPRYVAARQFAHEIGMPQETFSRLLGLDAQMTVSQNERINEMYDRQVESLGANGAQRISAVQDWINGRLGAEHGAALGSYIVTAAQVKAYEALQRLFVSGGVSSFSQTGRDQIERGISDEAYQAMSPAQRVNAARKNAASSAPSRS